MNDTPVRLVELGNYTNPTMDPEVQPPEAITSRFPASPNLWIDLADDGTFFAWVPEKVSTVEGGRKVKVTRQRLHWIEGDALAVAAPPAIPVNNPPAFDRPRGRAFLAADKGVLHEMRLADGARREVAVEGIDFAGKERRFQRVHALDDGRILLTVPHRGLGELYLARPSGSGSGLAATYVTAARGHQAKVTDQLVVIGASELLALALVDGRAHLLAQIPDVRSSSSV